MNSIIQKSLVLVFSLIVIDGCYNNSHIRTQRILKPGEKVVSANAGLNIISPNTMEAPYRLQTSGVSGARVGLSFLSLKKGYEQGFSFGLGALEDRMDFIIGYDIRRVKYSSTGVPHRQGLYVALNHINGSNDYGLQGGDVIQLRPYYMTITSENRKLYGGFHGLISLGTISRKDYGDDSLFKYSYNVSSFGVGVTGGSEIRLGSLMIQSQIDLSLVNQKHQSFDDAFPENEWISDTFNDFGPVISIGMALHQASPRATVKVSYSSVSPPKLASKTSYDPFTGQARPITNPSVIRYDPLTGKAIVNTSKPVFDPYTGVAHEFGDSQPEEKISPYSLLTQEEKAKLAIKQLSIRVLNGVRVQAKVLDVMDQGLLINRDNDANMSQEILYYTRIKSIRFQGPQKGWSGGVNGALKGCGLGVGIPLAISVLSSEPGFLFLSGLAVPPAALGGLIVGFSARDSYDINMMEGPVTQLNMEYRQKLIHQVVSQYLNDKFPKEDLGLPSNSGKP